MSQYKHQEKFAEDLAAQWMNGNCQHVRTTIRNLQNKAQAAYITGMIALKLDQPEGFVTYMHPNLK